MSSYKKDDFTWTSICCFTIQSTIGKVEVHLNMDWTKRLHYLYDCWAKMTVVNSCTKPFIFNLAKWYFESWNIIRLVRYLFVTVSEIFYVCVARISSWLGEVKLVLPRKVFNISTYLFRLFIDQMEKNSTHLLRSYWQLEHLHYFTRPR